MYDASKVCWSEHKDWFLDHGTLKHHGKISEHECKEKCAQSLKCKNIQYIKANGTCFVAAEKILNLKDVKIQKGSTNYFKKRCGDKYFEVDVDFYNKDKLKKRN